MIYLVTIILLLFLSIHYDINGKTKNRDFWYNVMLVVFILVAGLRWRIGLDTTNYLGNFYHEYPSLNHFSLEDYGIVKSPLYVLINSIVKSLGGRFYVVQIIQAAFVNILVFKFIKKHSTYIFTCLFFYAISCYTTYNMETMRASMGVVVCFFANDYALEKKWLKAYSLFIIAFLFHPEVIVMFVLPLFFFLRFNKIGILFLIASFVVGKILAVLLQDYLFLLEFEGTLQNKIASVTGSDQWGSGSEGGLIYIILSIVFPFIIVFSSLFYIKKYKPDSNLVKMEPFLMIGFAFVLIKYNFLIAYRYEDCFKFYFIFFYSELWVALTRTKYLERRLSIMRTLVVFFPLLFYFIYPSYIREKGKGYRYIPYNSVFERKINKEQQLRFNEGETVEYVHINRNEY